MKKLLGLLITPGSAPVAFQFGPLKLIQGSIPGLSCSVYVSGTATVLYSTDGTLQCQLDPHGTFFITKSTSLSEKDSSSD